MKLKSTVLVGRLGDERRVWTEEEITFEPRDHDKWGASYWLGRTAYRTFGTEWIHAEGAIYNEHGALMFYAAPSVVAEGVHDEYNEFWEEQ